MLKRSGEESYCIKCGKWQPIEGREKEANSHQHWCGQCIAEQNAEAVVRDMSDNAAFVNKPPIC